MGGVSASMGMASLGYRSSSYAGRVGFGQPIRRALHTLMGHGPTQMSMGGMGYAMPIGGASYSMPSSMAMGYGGMTTTYGGAGATSYSMPSYSAARTVYSFNGTIYDRLPITTWVRVPPSSPEAFYGVRGSTSDYVWIKRSYDGSRWITIDTGESDQWSRPSMSGDNKPVTQADLRSLEDRMTARMDRMDSTLRSLSPAQFAPQVPADIKEQMDKIQKELQRLVPAPAPKSQESSTNVTQVAVQNGTPSRNVLQPALQIVCQNGQVQVPPAPPPSPVDAIAARVKALKSSVDALAPLYSRVAELETQAKTLIDLSAQLDAIQLRLNQLSRPTLKGTGTVLPPPEIKEKQSGPVPSEVVHVRYQDAPVASPVYVSVKK